MKYSRRDPGAFTRAIQASAAGVVSMLLTAHPAKAESLTDLYDNIATVTTWPNAVCHLHPQNSTDTTKTCDVYADAEGMARFFCPAR
jgi:hypothetical protein